MWVLASQDPFLDSLGTGVITHLIEGNDRFGNKQSTGRQAKIIIVGYLPQVQLGRARFTAIEILRLDGPPFVVRFSIKV